MAKKETAVRVVLPSRSRPRPETRWRTTYKRCPHCGKVKVVDPDFGIVVKRDVQYAASWCRECRSATSYAYKPRKNRSKNWPGPESR